jgi:hypothetical protein
MLLATSPLAARAPVLLLLRRRHHGPLLLARALSSSSSSPPPKPPPKPAAETAASPRTSPRASAAAAEDGADQGEEASTTTTIASAAKDVHPALVSLLNSGFIESRRRLREELAEDAWRGEPIGGKKGSDEEPAATTTTKAPPPLPHTAPSSWAARRGIARFERFLAGGGANGADKPPPFPDGDAQEAAQLERAIQGLYAALEKGAQDDDEQHQVDSTRATLRALEKATAALPSSKHRLLARAFVEESLSEALKEEYKRAADESRSMADLWGTASGGGDKGGGVAAAAGGVVWRGVKKLLPWGWLGWLLPGGGGKGGKGNGGG